MLVGVAVLVGGTGVSVGGIGVFVEGTGVKDRTTELVAMFTFSDGSGDDAQAPMDRTTHPNATHKKNILICLTIVLTHNQHYLSFETRSPKGMPFKRISVVFTCLNWRTVDQTCAFTRELSHGSPVGL